MNSVQKNFIGYFYDHKKVFSAIINFPNIKMYFFLDAFVIFFFRHHFEHL